MKKLTLFSLAAGLFPTS